MNNNNLVSIIIPAFNAEKYVEETINSVLKQTYTNIEIIVVDDGSTDNTARLVEAICNMDSRIKLIRQRNQGVSTARNHGFSASKGSFIAYLDADDVLAINHLELILQKFFTDDALGLVHSDEQIIDTFSNRKDEFERGHEGYLLDNLLLGQRLLISGPSGSIIKREVVESVGGFDPDLSNCADIDFFFRVAHKYKIGRVSEVTWFYRIHSNNMHSNVYLLEKDTLTLFKKADEHKLFKNPKFRLKCYSNMYFMLAGSFRVFEKNKTNAIKYLIKSIIFYPPIILKILKKIFVS